MVELTRLRGRGMVDVDGPDCGCSCFCRERGGVDGVLTWLLTWLLVRDTFRRDICERRRWRALSMGYKVAGSSLVSRALSSRSSSNSKI